MTAARTAGSEGDRRQFLKRAAAVGAATAWAAPTVQSLVSPAFAVGSSPPTSCERLTGRVCIPGGSLTTCKGKTKRLRSITITIGDLRGSAAPPVNPQITVVVQRAKGTPLVFHFDTVQAVAVSTARPNPGYCPNRFAGTATGYLARRKRKHNQTLRFQLEDHGRRAADVVSIVISGPKFRITGGGVAQGLEAHCDC